MCWENYHRFYGGVLKIDLWDRTSLWKNCGGYMNVYIEKRINKWNEIAKLLGLAQENQETVKECYKEYIGMVKIYYEEAKRSKQEKPGKEVVGDGSGTAGIKEPQAVAEMDAEIGDSLDGTQGKTAHEINVQSRSEPKVNCNSATLHLVGDSLDLCQLHPNNLKKFSDMICSLQCLKKLTLKCNIPEFPKDLGRLECVEELCLYSTKIKHLPDSICMLKRLKSLVVNYGDIPGKLPEDLLEKLPEDLGQLECLEKLKVSSKKSEYLPDSICMLKRAEGLSYIVCVLGSCLRNWQVEFFEMARSVVHDLNILQIAFLELKHNRRIKVRSYLVPLIMDAARTTNAKTTGTHQRLIDILHPTAQTIYSLMQLDLPAGIDTFV
ncbi:disease resistance TIR-NBS-LRR class family protein [Tanacetum coccineum]